MTKLISTEIQISATPAKVWAILTQFDTYPKWNPFIKSIQGPAVVGTRIKARIEPPGASGMSFTPTVLAFREEEEFRWLGHFIFPGLFDGEHSFEIKDNNDGTVLFIQKEKFNGILVPLFKKMLDINTVNGFTQMNKKLKELAEA